MDEIIKQTMTTMTIVVNGQIRTTKVGSTINYLLQDLGIAPALVVVQLDGVIIPRDEFAQTTLHEESQIEIVTLVGGG